MTSAFWERFVDDTARQKIASGARSMGARGCRDLVARIDWTGDPAIGLVAGTAANLPPVMDELTLLYESLARDGAGMRVRALMFAMCTPRREVAHSIEWSRWAYPQWRLLANPDTAVTVARAYPDTHGRMIGINMYRTLAQYLHGAYPLVESIAAGYVPTLQDLESVRGIGPKVARMALAVMNPFSEHWTVDLWHGRQVLALAGEDYRVNPVIKDEGYPILESAFLALMRANLPADIPAFALQWAAWNVARGEHIPHWRIWSDRAPIYSGA